MENRFFLRGKSQAKRRQRVKEIIARWKSVFAEETTKVGVTDYVDPFNIELETGTKPVRQRTRPLTPVQVETLKKQLADWTADGIIAPSASAWASPLVPEMKKDGTVRWAIDFCALNPTPNITDVLQTFAGSKCFSTLDASQAYMNIPVKKNCQSMTAFVCCFGVIEFLCMPFGLKNAGAAYCRLVQSVADEINDPRLSTYLDDVILHTGGPDAHMNLLERTLEAHYQSGIKLKPKKTILFEAAVDYLGFSVDKDGIYMTDKYVQQVKDWPHPTSGKELATALGFFGYYFLPKFAELTAEMNEVKTKKRWEEDTWTTELQSKFQQVKDLFTDPAGAYRTHPMALGEPGAGEFILITAKRQWA